MKRPTMVKRLLLTFTKSSAGVRISVGEGMPTGTPDAVLFESGRADAGLDITIPLPRRLEVLERMSGSNGLATFTFDPPYTAAPDVTPRLRASTGLLAGTCEIVSVSTSQAVIRVNKVLAGSPVLAAGVAVSLRVEALS